MIWLLLGSTLTVLVGVLMALAVLSNTLAHLRAMQLVAADVVASDRNAANPPTVPAR